MTIRSAYSYLYPLCLLLMISSINALAQKKITDTIYYNRAWKICEEPIATYYRVGTLAFIDSIWYYTGKVKDYTTGNSLVMEGEYDDNGLKSGTFKFYYVDGKLQATGKYENGRMFGTWKWFYPGTGSEKAQIYFTANEQDFKFISFKDEKGNKLMDNGIGKYTWATDAFETEIGYIVNGAFNLGKREGKWDFDASNGMKNLDFKEFYDENGQFTKTKLANSYFTGRTAPYEFHFSPYRFMVMESVEYDNYFRRNGDSLAATALFNYLINHKPTEIRLKYKNFDSAFAFILQTLYGYRGVFDYKSKDIDADIEFRLGFKGSPEDISFTGTGLNAGEKKFLLFIISKFANIQMPGTSSIAIEGYHDIYMYDIDISKYYPADMKRFSGKELFFSQFPKQKMQEMLDANKKNIKKFLRKIFDY